MNRYIRFLTNCSPIPCATSSRPGFGPQDEVTTLAKACGCPACSYILAFFGLYILNLHSPRRTLSSRGIYEGSEPGDVAEEESFEGSFAASAT